MRAAETNPHPASYWQPVDKGRVQCLLCPFNCVLPKGKTSICRGKENIGGELYAVNYGLTTSINIDPVEKKPLYNFYPGTKILSIGPNGCNLRCDFCQNYYISQEEAQVTYLAPEKAAELSDHGGCIGVAYTYTEPSIWFEYVLDTAKAIRAKGLKNVLVTNGMINREPLEEILPWIDAMNVDIKSMDKTFYKKTCRGKLDPVLETVKRSVGSTHIEITNLVIPGLNDSDEMFEKLTDFLAELDPMIPLHFSRYHPDYKQTASATPLDTLYHAADIASKKLKHVYVGNIMSDSHSQTRCPECGKVVIERSGYSIPEINIIGGKCGFCGAYTGVVMDS